MLYSRSFLFSETLSPEKRSEVIQTLIDYLSSGKALTIAESKFVGNFIERANVEDIDGLIGLQKMYDRIPYYHFWQLYLKYAQDPDGEGIIKDILGEIPRLQKEFDTNFLNNQYLAWKPIVENKNNKTTILQYLTKESRADIFEAMTHARQLNAGARFLHKVEKTLVLHNKFVHSKIEEYYEEYDVRQDVIRLCGWEVLVDSFVYGHVAIRHMAPWTKFGRPGKTFIGDKEIDIDVLPRIIISFLNGYENNIGCDHFDPARVFFRFNDRDYVIRFKKHPRQVKGGAPIEFLRVETMYPAELRNDLELVSKMRLIQVSDRLGYYV